VGLNPHANVLEDRKLAEDVQKLKGSAIPFFTILCTGRWVIPPPEKYLPPIRLMKPVIRLNKVVFPAPLGPMTETSSPLDFEGHASDSSQSAEALVKFSTAISSRSASPFLPVLCQKPIPLHPVLPWGGKAYASARYEKASGKARMKITKMAPMKICQCWV